MVRNFRQIYVGIAFGRISNGFWVQWLVFLGPILRDFKQLEMEFKVNNKKVVLRGSSSAQL